MLKGKTKRPSKTFVYLRISTDRQNIGSQEGEIVKFCKDHDIKDYEITKDENVSGKVTWKKRKIADILEQCISGDTIIVPELSRLGRHMLEVMEILSICSQRNINLLAVKGNFKLDGSIQSKMIAMCYSLASEIERNLISERVKNGMNRARLEGKVIGGQNKGKILKNDKLDPHKQEIIDLVNMGVKQKIIANKFKCTEMMLSNYIKKHQLKIKSMFNTE